MTLESDVWTVRNRERASERVSNNEYRTPAKSLFAKSVQIDWCCCLADIIDATVMTLIALANWLHV